MEWENCEAPPPPEHEVEPLEEMKGADRLERVNVLRVLEALSF